MNLISSRVTIPQGQTIELSKDVKKIPNNPIIPYIEGDGIGQDITPVMIEVVNAAVEKAYGSQKKIAWVEVYAGEKAQKIYGEKFHLPEETLELIKNYKIAIKGPLTTPVGGGIRSLNVALRQELDLYICLRPVRYFSGVPSPLKNPEHTDMVIFRENSEDIYAGIEYKAGTDDAKKVIDFLKNEMGVKKIRFSENCGIGIKPVSMQGTKRLVRAAIDYAIAQGRKSVTIVHKGNIMKYTEGAFKEWAYQVAQEEYGASFSEKDGYKILSPKNNQEITIKDSIADAFLQQILLRPKDYDVIATLNLNGDYISDALAAQVGGIGIAPGANIGDCAAVFEATHGTAPKYAGQDKVNPGSILLSAEMMLRYMNWHEAADFLITGMEQAILDRQVTYDFHRLMEGASLLSCSKFGRAIIERMR